MKWTLQLNEFGCIVGRMGRREGGEQGGEGKGGLRRRGGREGKRGLGGGGGR